MKFSSTIILWIKALISPSRVTSSASTSIQLNQTKPSGLINLITLEQYLMGRDVEYPPTAAQLANANNTLTAVNALLTEIGVTDARVRSGYRPGHYNIVAGGAPSSKHLTCEACDVADDNDGSLNKKITYKLLAKHGLYREHPTQTPTWVHLQTVAPKSGRRTFLK